MKIAYYGERGAYSEQAAIQHFKASGELKPRKFLSDVFDAVENGCDFGVVPIENSLEGAVTQTYDLLLESDLTIVGEEIVKISHSLMAAKGVLLDDIKTVYSHPQALAQSREYIEKHMFNTIPYYDTAGSAKMIKESGMRNAGAIASERAAKIYGMQILASGIESNKHNYTRFMVISKENKTKEWNKTSIAFSAKHRPGSLFSALNCFARNKVNLSYIQSRPIPGMPWEYNFYVDCDGSINDKKIRKAVNELFESADFIKVLGSYKKARFDINV